jgi:hypothetical protein
MVYNEIGDIGFRTDTFRSYRESVERYVVEKLRPVFKPEYPKWFVEKYGDDKARRAWSTVVTLLAFHRLELLKEAGARPREFLPEEYDKFCQLGVINLLAPSPHLGLDLANLLGARGFCTYRFRRFKYMQSFLKQGDTGLTKSNVDGGEHRPTQ